MRKKNSGFTVIEVSLVLALAGLIFLMAFLALPALNRSQRDTSRREAVTKVVREIKNYQSNNGRGNLPGTSDNITTGGMKAINAKTALAATNALATSWNAFYRLYLGADFVDPNGEQYNLVISSCGTSTPDKDCATGSNGLNTLYSAKFPNGYNIYIVTSAKCSGEKAVAVSNPRNAAVLYRLEGAGIYCNSSSL